MEPQNRNSNIFVITGMHRSGTSLTAALLQSSGLDVGQKLLGPSPSNVKGHFEDIDFFEFHESVLHSQGISKEGWTLERSIQVPEQYLDRAKSIIHKNLSKPLWGWKDPRTTIFLNFWSDLIPEAKYLFIYRSPWEVIDSLYRRGDDVFSTNPSFALKVWINYNNALIDYYEQFPDKCLLLSINSISYDPNFLIKVIEEKFGIALTLPAKDIYDSSLLHNQASSSHRAALIKHYCPEAFDLYHELNARSGLINSFSSALGHESAQFQPYILWAFQDWVDVRRIETELKRSQLQLQQTQEQLQQTQGQLQQTYAELERLQFHIEETFQNAQTEREQFQSELQHIQLELGRSQFYLEETFQNAQAERERFQSKIQQLQAELENLQNEGVKALLKKFFKKILYKLIRSNFILKSEKVKNFLKRLKNKLQRQKEKKILTEETLLAFSNLSREDFWKILDPVIQTHLNILGEEPPKISILTPTWNSSLGWFIETALSVLNQSLPNWEWCIVDDGSKSQDIRDILNDLAHKHPRIKVVFQESGGISIATNKAIEIATGDYVCFLDHDDTLTSAAMQELVDKLSEGFDVVYSDEDKIDFSGLHYTESFFKPDWSPEYFRGVMYVGHLLCVRRDLAIAVGGLKSEYDGVQDYEFMLRISEVTKSIGHIQKILYHWRKVQGSIAGDINAKAGIENLQQKAVNAHLERMGLPAKAEISTGNHRVKIVPGSRIHHPLISIIIPTKDAPHYLGKCLKSIFTLSTYRNFEVILVDNETTDIKALQIMKEFSVKLLHFPNPFNYSCANNLGAKFAQGDYLVFLNNDTEVVTEDWLQYILYYAEQPDVGAVGSLLLFPDRTVQHAGVVMGFRGTSDHVMRGFPFNVDGYAGSLVCARETSAVTGACMMVKKSDFDNIGGFNEHFFTHYQDVDLCMRLIKNGKKNIFTPRAVLIHHESKTRKSYYDMIDRILLLDQWQEYIDSGDPFYNQNFDIASYDYTIKSTQC